MEESQTQRSLETASKAVPIPVGKGLVLAEDGIWYGHESGPLSYPGGGNEACFAIEDRSFWFQHRNRCIVALAKRYPPPQGGAILDIGGGNGFVSVGLANARFNVTLLEPGLAGAHNARRRGLRSVICATLEGAGFGFDSWPALGLFDVIEHIQDDGAYLKSLRRLLQPGGRIYLTTPAYSLLWSAEDVAAGHYRRYTMRSIREQIEGAGLVLDYATYIFRALPAPILLFRALPYRLGFGRSEAGVQVDASTNDHIVRGSLSQAFLDFVLNPEISNIENAVPMRFGGSILLTARRP